jgi:SAM-dependent methyltransferase
MDLREQPAGPFRRHPWEVARSRFFAGLIERHAGSAPARVLDVGSGDAWFARELAIRSQGRLRIVCWDEGYRDEDLRQLASCASGSLRFCAERPLERFGWLLLLDVLEHVEHDAALLAGLARENLEPGGRALVSVPAWPALFNQHDRNLGHLRRYSPRRCLELLRQSGLRVLLSGGLFTSLLPLRAAQALLEARDTPAAPLAPAPLAWRHGERAARLAERWLALDAALGATAGRLRLHVPGLSCWALCERSR